MTRWIGALIQVWGWVSITLVAGVLASALGLLVGRLAPDAFGLLGVALCQTVPVLLGTLAVVAPVALLSAIALDQTLPRGPVVEVLGRVVAAAGGVPPVVYGVVGAMVAPWVGVGTAVLVLALAVLPGLTLSLTRVLRRTEPEERLAAQALGATPIQVLLHVVGPAATGGVVAAFARTAGIVLGLAAPLLLLQPVGPMPIAWQVVERAARGDLGVAAVLALGLLTLALAARAVGVLADRRVAWRLP